MAPDEDERLEEIGEEIEKARRHAQDDKLIPGGQEDEHPYYESGDDKDEDDQEIAP